MRGDVVVRSYTDDPADVAAYGALSSKDGTRAFELSVKRVTSKGVVARVAGVDDRDQAEALKGEELYVARDQLGDVDDGSFYYADLIGLRVFDAHGAAVGEVVSVENFGAGDILEVRLSDRKQTEYVPFQEDFVPEVDVAQGRVVVDLARSGLVKKTKS